jgi:hypothetical protein
VQERLVTVALSVAATLGLQQLAPHRFQELEVDRSIVRKELIVSDTGQPWEKGYEEHQLPRGIYARALFDGPGGLWVRSRLIKGEIDDPFDDRFHAIERDGTMRRAPGHISWNVWLDGAWRQMAIVQGEGVEPSIVGVQGGRTAPSPTVRAAGLATLRWDSVPGADAYVVLRDGKPVGGALRIEGSQKEWADLPRK